MRNAQVSSVDKRWPVVVTLLLSCTLWIVPDTVSGDVSNPEYTYSMFYPKYAKGRQQTVFDIGAFDNINLYNGGLSLTLPLGPPLNPGADLQWRLVLQYSSKFWSWDKRGTGGECEGQGYVVGDAYAGVGWSLKLPHIHLRQEYDPFTESWQYFLDSVITSDGARHQLRRCLEGWDCRAGAPQPEMVEGKHREYWYAADGSGWRVYRTDSDQQFPELTSTQEFVAENNGRLYTFARRHLLDSKELGDEKKTDTDFESQARGWYCTRIESIRWPGPRIDISYEEQPVGSPIPSTISAWDVDGKHAGRITAETDQDHHTITTLRYLDANYSTRLRFSFAYERNRKLRVRASDATGWGWSCAEDPDRRLFTEEFSYLTDLSMTGSSGELLSWNFGTFQEEADPAGDPDGEIDAEPKGRVRVLTLPTGARVDYDYEQWIFYYPALSASAPSSPGPVLIDISQCPPLLSENSRGTDPGPDPEMYSSRQKVWAVADRKVVDIDNRLLEWTEYQREALGALVNAYEPFFDFSNTLLAEPESGLQLVPDPTHKDRFYSGVAATVVRRHLVTDHEPGEAAEDLAALASEGLVIDLPTARYDDSLHIFATGRLFYDSDDDGYAALIGSDGQFTDLYGTLPLEARPLEVRRFRGPHFVDGESPWYCAADENPRLLEQSFFEYTLDREHGWPLHGEFKGSCSGPLGGYAQYCGSRQESVRLRREITVQVGASLLEDAGDDLADPLFSGTEHWYETDHDCQPASDCEYDWRNAYGFEKVIYSPKLSFNEVLRVSTSDFTVNEPTAGDFDLRSVSLFEKSFAGAKWLPSQLEERIATLADPPSFDRKKTIYADNGSIARTRHHLAMTGSSSGDVVTDYDYYETASTGTVFGYGKPRTVTTSKMGTSHAHTRYAEGTTYSASGGSLYAEPFTVEDWRLCLEGAEVAGRCPGWGPAPAVLGGGKGEPKSRTAMDPFWRRPISVTDGNGDGLETIAHDDLGRLVRLEPTDPDKSQTWLEYDPQLRWSEVRIENVAGDPTVVRRTEHDGLGRPVHAAVRRAGRTGSEYQADGFRHQTTAYDGVVTAWATSHWLTNAAPILPTSFSTHETWDITASVDPSGRPERVVASDGGLHLSAYRGKVWSQSVTLEPELGGLSRKFLRFDARGEIFESWEDKSAPPHDPPLFLTIERMTPWRFVQGTYSKDVAGRLLRVAICGQDANGVLRTQQRSMVYDSLGNLVYRTLPEYGIGNGTVAYEDFDARGNPRRTVLNSSPLEARETTYDAAGRVIESWSIAGPNRYLVGATDYGTQAVDHEIGKPVRSTRYNLVSSLVEACPDGCVPSDAIGVTHLFGYTDHGLLAGRSTEVRFGGAAGTGSSQLFTLGYEYDRWGNIDRIYYPELAGIPTCALAAPTIDAEWGPVALASIIDASTGHALFYSPEYDGATGMLTGWRSVAGTLTGIESVPGWVEHGIAVDSTRARPKRITAWSGSMTYFDSGTYDYDATGNILNIGGWHYEYDDLGRLSTATGPAGQRSYSYDDFGNLVEVGAKTIGIDAAANRLAGSSYDLQGNLTSEFVADSWTRRLRFDLDNRLVAAWATGPDAPADQFGFAYDQAGERVLKFRVYEGEVVEATFSLRDQEGNVLTDFLWTPKTAGSTTGKWYRLADHVFLGRRPIVHRESQGGYPVTYTTVVTDHLQSTRAEITDSTEPNARASFSYWPFGEFAARLGAPAAKHLFTAHEREDTGTEEGTLSGLDYMHARYYSQVDGRFLGLDPIESGVVGESQGWNRYGYVEQNPLRRIDPNGENIWDLADPLFFAASIGNLWRKALSGEHITAADNLQVAGDALGMIPIVPAVGTWGRAAREGVKHSDEAVDILRSVSRSGGAVDLAGRNRLVLRFHSFSHLKRVLGPAGDGKQWHHIVEQSKVTEFGAQTIHSTENVVALSFVVHKRVSAYYSSKRRFTGGKTVRQWLKGKSYEEQREFGRRIIRAFSDGG